MADQGYVSDELSHFVSRNKTKEEALDILIKILTSKRLMMVPGIGGPVPCGVLIPPDWSTASPDEVFRGDWVCFCDIPFKQLRIHSTKYGEYGLSFKKGRLLKYGANPVFYIDIGSLAYFPKLREIKQKPDIELPRAKGRRDGLVSLLRDIKRRLIPIAPGDPDDWVLEYTAACRTLQEVFEMNFLAFVKFFDSSLAEDDPCNYYMEREWRVLGEVRFELEDVSRIFAPAQDVASLRERFPELIVQILPAERGEV